MSKADECLPSESDEVGRDHEEPDAPHEVPEADMSGPEVAKQLGVTLRALRFYESRGLISPRREGRARIYSRADQDRVVLILRAKKLGFTLSEIASMIDPKTGRAHSGLQLTAVKCLKQIHHLEDQLNTIVEALADLRRIHLELCREAGEDGPE